MLFPSDIHHHHHHHNNNPDSPPRPPPPHSADTPHSDSGRSLSSTSSGEIMGTPFDLGAQRFEYPFPPAQGSPTDPFLPLSSSITPHSHAQSPPWPIHISKSFPLTPPPLGKLKAHPKLRTASVREPPVPPGLVKRRSRIAGIQHQSSSEEPSDRSDVGDEITRAHRPSSRVLLTLTEVVPRKPPPSEDATSSRSEIVPVKHAVSLPIGSFDRPTVQDHAEPVMPEAGSAEGTPRATVLQQEVKANRLHDQIYSFMLYCWIVASQLPCLLFRFLGWFSRA